MVKLSDSDKSAIEIVCRSIEYKLVELLTDSIKDEYETVDRLIFGFKFGTIKRKKIPTLYFDEFISTSTFSDCSSLNDLGECVIKLGLLVSVGTEDYTLGPDMAHALAVVIEKFGE